MTKMFHIFLIFYEYKAFQMSSAKGKLNKNISFSECLSYFLINIYHDADFRSFTWHKKVHDIDGKGHCMKKKELKNVVLKY